MTASYRDPETLERLYYDEDLSLSEIGARLGCCEQTVLNWMEKHGIERRRAAHERGSAGRDNPRWVERATFGTPDGYERAECRSTREYVKVHRLCAVAWYGYETVVGNDVHHENGVPWDNREGNISVLSPSAHRRLHAANRSRDARGRWAGETADAEAHDD